MLEIKAKITGLKYSPQLCRKLNSYGFEDKEKC